MAKELSFRASTNVKNLLGKDLVTDQFTAVFELVKNAYDADATEVKLEFNNLINGDGLLIIEDNGVGMSLEDIKDKWMVIGTDSKKNVIYSEKYKRPLNGDKGIGRFSVDRLGSLLKLESIKENSRKKVEMNFSWNQFEVEFGKLEDVKIPYSVSLNPLKKTGVVLNIGDLRDKWELKGIEKLISNLRQFKSPFTINDNFKIIINVPEYQIVNHEIEPFKLEQMSSFWVESSISIEKQDTIKVKVVRDGVHYTEEFSNPYNFGPVKTKVYFFDTGDKISFNHKMNMRVKDFGNIRLYRDDFRIHPYGENYNDWLDLDIRKAQGYARFFGSRDLIGYVQIYKVFNTGIDAPTNRQGLIENEHSQQLRDFIKEYTIKVLEKYFLKRSKNESFMQSKVEIESAVTQLRKVTKEINKSLPETAKILREITGVVEKSQKEQTKFVKNQEELLEVYKRVASKEVLLHQIIHQALIKIEKVITVAHSGERKIEIEENPIELKRNLTISFENIKKLTFNTKDYLKKARDHLIRKRKPESINLFNFLKQINRTFSQLLITEEIEVELLIPSDIQIKMDKNDLETIIDNFFSNSIKSLQKSNKESKKITVKVVESNSNITFLFKDNGDGIPLNIRNRIFDPFFSSTNSSGMGLSIVDEIVKENKGELNLTVNENIGAEFQIKFRK